MVQIESVLERGEKIDSLVQKSDGLSAQSKMFYTQVSHIEVYSAALSNILPRPRSRILAVFSCRLPSNHGPSRLTVAFLLVFNRTLNPHDLAMLFLGYMATCKAVAYCLFLILRSLVLADSLDCIVFSSTCTFSRDSARYDQFYQWELVLNKLIGKDRNHVNYVPLCARCVESDLEVLASRNGFVVYTWASFGLHSVRRLTTGDSPYNTRRKRNFQDLRSSRWSHAHLPRCVCPGGCSFSTLECP